MLERILGLLKEDLRGKGMALGALESRDCAYLEERSSFKTRKTAGKHHTLLRGGLLSLTRRQELGSLHSRARAGIIERSIEILRLAMGPRIWQMAEKSVEVNHDQS